jgi:hypothetical protein
MRLYLTYVASGEPIASICKKLPNVKASEEAGKPVYGIDVNTVAFWRHRYPWFTEAEKRTKEDPGWFHREVMVPLRVAMLDVQDMEAIQGLNGRSMKQFTAKDRELILQEAGHLERGSGVNEQLLSIVREGMQFSAAQRPQIPASVTIDVTPQEA